ncbi:MAG: peptidoglycan-associated lipoprotein Pal [Candidatus Eisenbacteria bacterium]|nr:peptidoglycan-associated lipoprotein Pal [Candidatus Eisenbacteria bacterium]
MFRNTSFLKIIFALTILLLIASCGSKKELVPPEPVEKEQTAPVSQPDERDRQGVPAEKPDVDPDAPYVFQNVHFEFDKYRLTTDATRILNAHAEVLMRHPAWTVRIEGHCDERGTVEYNLALGEKRANAAKDFLVGYGVAASRVRTVSYGKERPIDAGHGEAAWAKNRRGEFHVTRTE